MYKREIGFLKIIVFFIVCFGSHHFVKAQEKPLFSFQTKNSCLYERGFTFSPQSWITYQDPHHLFSITFPGNPQLKNHVLQTRMGKLNFRVLSKNPAFEQKGNRVYLLMYSHIPKTILDSIKTQDPNQFLTLATNQTLAYFRGTLEESQKSHLGSHSVHNYSFTCKKGMVRVNARDILVNDHIYMLKVLTVNGLKGNLSQIEQFFDSFKLSN